MSDAHKIRYMFIINFLSIFEKKKESAQCVINGLLNGSR